MCWIRRMKDTSCPGNTGSVAGVCELRDKHSHRATLWEFWNEIVLTEECLGSLWWQKEWQAHCWRLASRLFFCGVQCWALAGVQFFCSKVVCVCVCGVKGWKQVCHGRRGWQTSGAVRMTDGRGQWVTLQGVNLCVRVCVCVCVY